MTRRAAGEGNLRERKNGRWEARLLLTGPDGRRRRRSLLARTQKEARAKLQQALLAEAGGLPHVPTSLSVGTFLGQWLHEGVAPHVRPSTYRSYEGIVRVHLIPGLGHNALARLTPQQVQAFLNAKSSSGLAPRTVAYLRAVLRQALTQAERWGLVTRNVAKLAQPPRIARSEIRPLTWSDIDLTAATIRVRHALQRVDGRLELVESKSVTSHRVVPAPAIVLDALREHRRRQLREHLLAGSRWRYDARDLVFTTTVGTPMDGVALTRHFKAVVAAAGLPTQRFHDLRHACASLLLAQGSRPGWAWRRSATARSVSR